MVSLSAAGPAKDDFWMVIVWNMLLQVVLELAGEVRPLVVVVMSVRLLLVEMVEEIAVFWVLVSVASA